MKIACEKCNKAMQEHFVSEYKKIMMNNKVQVFCNECHKKLTDWIYKPERGSKGIRDKVIDEFAARLINRCSDLSQTTKIDDLAVDILTLDAVADIIGEVAERMKEVGG